MPIFCNSSSAALYYVVKHVKAGMSCNDNNRISDTEHVAAVWRNNLAATVYTGQYNAAFKPEVFNGNVPQTAVCANVKFQCLRLAVYKPVES